MRRAQPLLGCLGCLLVLGVSACSHSAAPPSKAVQPPSSPSSPPATGVATVTTHDNVVATRKLSAWMLRAVPMPPGARQWQHSPTAHYRHASMGIGPSDPKLTRTTWWTVPLSESAFEAWLRHHAPHGLTLDPDSAAESQGVSEIDQDFSIPSTDAHTEGWVNFAFTPYDGALAVRVDTFVGARFARTVRVPKDTTSVTIRRTRQFFDTRREPRITTRTVTDPATMARLVALVNALPGVMTVPFVASCPMMLVQQGYQLTFTGPQGSYVARLTNPGCFPQVTLSHDGAAAGPRLDPGQTFTKAVDRVLAS